jgi:hypothetical protein
MFGFLWDKYSLNIAVLYSVVVALTAIVGMVIFVTKYTAASKV